MRHDHAYGDVKDILETWRLRLPNAWDPLLHWQDVLVWRNAVYNVVIAVRFLGGGVFGGDGLAMG